MRVRELVKGPVSKVIRRYLPSGRFSSEHTIYRAESGREARLAIALWNRPGRIDDVLRLVDGQDHPEGVRLFLWNNNRSDHEHYRRRIAAFRPQGALRSVRLKKSPYNIGGMARFYWASWLLAHGESGPVLFLDDDEDITPRFVSAALAAYEPNVIAAFWAWRVEGSYWNRERAAVGEPVSHVGPGGSVVDLSFFADRRFFTKTPEEFWLLDDIWFTHVARNQGRQLRALDVEIEFVLNETNQYHGQIDLKPRFYEFLQQHDPLAR